MYSGIFPLKLPWEFIPSLRVRYTTFGSIAFSVLKRPCHNLKCKTISLSPGDLVVWVSLKVVHQNIYLWQFDGQKIISSFFALYMVYHNLEIFFCMLIVLPQEQALTMWHDHNDQINSPLQFDITRRKKLLYLWEIIFTLVEIFHVYYTWGKSGVTFVENFFITPVGNFITLVCLTYQPLRAPTIGIYTYAYGSNSRVRGVPGTWEVIVPVPLTPHTGSLEHSNCYCSWILVEIAKWLASG